MSVDISRRKPTRVAARVLDAREIDQARYSTIIMGYDYPAISSNLNKDETSRLTLDVREKWIVDGTLDECILMS